MKVQSFCLFFFLLVTSTLGEDTVAEDIGVHQMERLVEMLTSKECKDLLFALSHPEENIFTRLKRLSAEHEPLDLKPRAERDAPAAAGSEAPCRAALTDWMQRHGQQTYFDRLSRALQHVGRTDIAIEVGKNINQDKALNLKRYVEDYHKYVESLNFPPKQKDSKDQHQNREVKTRRVRDLTFRDLDLIVERAPVSLYLKGPMDVALPFLSGILLGFGGTLLAGVLILLVVIHIANRNQRKGHPRVASRQLRVKNAGPERSEAEK